MSSPRFLVDPVSGDLHADTGRRPRCGRARAGLRGAGVQPLLAATPCRRCFADARARLELAAERRLRAALLAWRMAGEPAGPAGRGHARRSLGAYALTASCAPGEVYARWWADVVLEESAQVPDGRADT